MTASTENSTEFYERIRSACDLLLNRNAEAAIEIIEVLQRERPNAPENLYLMGFAAITMGEIGRALMFLEAAHDQDPECFEYAEVLANLHVRVGNLAEGVYFAKLSTVLDPHPFIYNLIPADLSNFFESLENASVPRHYAYGYVKLQQHEYEIAAREFDRQLMILSEDADALRDVSRAHLQLGNLEQAIASIQKAIHLRPEDAVTHFRAGQVSKRIGAKDAALYHFKKACELDTESLPLASACFALSASIDTPAGEEIAFIEAELQRRVTEAPERPPEAVPSTAKKERIHIGYVTNNSWNADSAALLEPILKGHDRGKFEVYLYQLTPGRSAYIQQLNNAVNTDRRLWELDDETAAVIIGGDEIDILVNCCSPELNNRAPLFAMSPATIQVGYLGSNYGAKFPGLKHVLSDAMMEETIRPQLHENQQLTVIRPGLWSTDPSYMLPEVSPLPAKAKQHVTFGAHCDCEALTPKTVALFTSALEAVPGSRLLFGAAGSTDSYPRRLIAQLFEPTGMADRVSVFDETVIGEQWIPDAEYWHEIDIFLVPGALNAPLRASDALWMGIPVVTIAGNTSAARTCASILASSTQLQWSRETPAEWLAVITELAGDLDALAEIRASLRGKVKTTALFNPFAHIREMEAFYTHLVETRDT